MKRKYINRLIEFFIIGIAMGITEDILAITIATDAPITANVLLVVFLVALPFAAISELVVDWRHFKKKLDHVQLPPKLQPKRL